MTGAIMYIDISVKLLAKIAGPIDLAGFIEAPVNGPATNEHTDIIPPIDRPIIDLEVLLFLAMLIIVSIKKILISISKQNPLKNDNLLIVIPKPWSVPKNNLWKNDAEIAPMIWDGI